MRILFYAHSSTLYGANRSMIDLILGMKYLRSDLDICVVIPKDEPLGSELQSNNINFKIIDHYNWFYNHEVGHKWNSKSKFQFNLWFLKNRLTKKIKNHIQIYAHLNFARKFKPDLIYINSSLNPMGLIVSERLGIINVWHHRETVNEPIYGFYLDSLKDFNLKYRQANFHLFPSKFLSEFYKKSFGQYPSKIIYNGVVSNKIKQSRDFNHGKIRFGIVGRINNQKRQKEVIEIFNKLSKLDSSLLELHVIGAGDEEFSTWLKKLKPTNVFYHKFLDRYTIYDKFDFLISNASNEAFGRTIAEANYNGIPAIARNSGAFPELIISGENGFLFNDYNELTECILSLTSFTQNQYHDFSHKSYLHAKQQFDYVKVAKKVFSEIESII